MKKKAGQRAGASAKHRLWSERSTVSRLPYKCRFCGGSGTGAKYHSSSSSCPVKLSWGEVSVEIKKTELKEEHRDCIKLFDEECRRFFSFQPQ